MRNVQINSIFDRLLENKWFSNCGNEVNVLFRVKYVSYKEEAISLINSIEWENTCLKKKSDLTSALSNNNIVTARRYNNTVNEVKRKCINALEKDIETGCENMGFPRIVKDDIKMNILSLFIYIVYQKYYHDDFFYNLCEIYLQGNLPCGYDEINDIYFVY